MAGKEAVVFILDTFPSMNSPYPKDSESTRLSQAKRAVINAIADQSWRSKTHECGCIVLKTGLTHHHMAVMDGIDDENALGYYFRKVARGKKVHVDLDDEVHFPNLIEFDLNRITPQTLRAISHVCSTSDESNADVMQGDLCDGLIVAADALYQRTNGKKFKRKIVLFTDAEHKVSVDGSQLQAVLDGLNKMECEVIVVGIGFDDEKDFSSIAKSSNDAGIKQEDDDDDLDQPDKITSNDAPTAEESDSNIKEEGDVDNEDMEDLKMESDSKARVKRENQMLLMSIAKETGGCVLATNGADIEDTLQRKMPSKAGRKNAQRYETDFHIAPNLTVAVRLAKMTEQCNLPSLKKGAVQFDPESGDALRDGAGELMTHDTGTLTRHFEAEQLEAGIENEVPLDMRVDAYRYGCDLIPVGKMDLAGINAAFAGDTNRSIEVIGYLGRDDVVDSGLLMGPAYCVVGGKESNKSRSAVAALAQAMDETGKVGFCRLVKTKNGGAPIIGALFPMTSDGGRHLQFLQLPFADDVQHFQNRDMDPFTGSEEQVQTCEDLIDSLMLPDGDFERVSNPTFKAYRQMIVDFAMNAVPKKEELREEGLPEENILLAAQPKPLCEFDATKILAKKASGKISAFLEEFPLQETKEDEKKKKYWGDDV
ncbi:X-ray repair cross-complementing protein 5 [Skeletonema marinoi]|uniref:X-ray repair cross-complementing protein 5 n=1 Tax=Skeletonema marinoi TaxID=267567 RepID=A0AAD8YBK7_9STRA|nr:X-ray repair cross-complementing protein 5 [Skeletonema marinoi]